MENKGFRGVALFLLAMGLMGGLLALSWQRFRQGEEHQAGLARLLQGQANILLRSYMFVEGSQTPAPAKASDLLKSAADGFADALKEQPGNLELRFATAVVQREAGEVLAAAKTLTGTSASERRGVKYFALASLAIDSSPDPTLLSAPGVMEFIERSPVRRLWLASVYARTGQSQAADEQWQLAYREAAPYVIGMGAILGAWALASLVGIICFFSLLGNRRAPAVLSDEAPTADPRPTSQAPDLAVAAIGFISWLLLQIGLSAAFAMAFPPSRLPGATALMGTIASFLAALAVIGWLRLRFPPVSLGWSSRPLGLKLRVAFAVFLLSPIMMGIVRLLQYYFNLEPREPSMMVVAEAQSIPMRVLVLVGASVLVPIGEETAFRGLLFRGLRTQWGVVAAMVISSLAFSLGHLDLLAALPIFLFGLGLAWSVKRTGSLFPAVVAHGLFNLFPLLIVNLLTL